MELIPNSAIGTFNYGHSYLGAARALFRLDWEQKETHSDSPIEFLFWHSIELFLKPIVNGRVKVGQRAEQNVATLGLARLPQECAPVIRLFALSLALALGAFFVKADEHPAFQQGFVCDHANAVIEGRAICSLLEDSPFTDEEAERHIRTAIEYWINNVQYATVWAEASDGSYEGRRERPIVQYTSVDEFLAANPRCCYFHTHTSDGYRPGPWFRYWNNYLGIVSINKIRITYADTGETIIHSGVGSFIDAHGKVIESPPAGR